MMDVRLNIQTCLCICLLGGLPVGRPAYVGYPLPADNSHVTVVSGAHKVFINTELDLKNGTLIGFSFLTVASLPAGITTIYSVRLQIWEVLNPTIPFQAKLVLEKKVPLSAGSFDRNITVMLSAEERINLTSSHKLGLTNEGAYCIVYSSKNIEVLTKDIVEDHYPEVGQTLDIPMPFPLIVGQIMGILSLQPGEEDYSQDVQTTTAEAVVMTTKEGDVTFDDSGAVKDFPNILLMLLLLLLLLLSHLQMAST